jgi:hypothetical protein
MKAHRLLLSVTILLLAAGMIFYFNGVLMPLRIRQSHLDNTSNGNWSDLYPRWFGARELLWHRRNPYSPEITREIQRGFYGHPLDPSNPKDPKDEEAFVYPVYVVFFLVPSLPFPFQAVQSVFTAIMLLLTAASFPLWLRALRLSLQPDAVALGLLAVMSSYAVVYGIHLDQITLLVAPLIAGSMAALASGQLLVAGILLALATVKPQLALSVVTLALVWTLGEWRSRKSLALGFGATMAGLLIGSELILPGWFGYWRQAANDYAVKHGSTLLEAAMGHTVGRVMGGAVVLAGGFLFWRARKAKPGSPQFNFALVTALVATQLLLPNAVGSYYNQVLLIPAVLWMFTPGWALAKNRGFLPCLAWFIAFNVLAWQWIWASSVSFAAILHHHFQREATLLVVTPELLIVVFPLTLALFILSVSPQALRQGQSPGPALPVSLTVGSRAGSH